MRARHIYATLLCSLVGSAPVFAQEPSKSKTVAALGELGTVTKDNVQLRGDKVTDEALRAVKLSDHVPITSLSIAATPLTNEGLANFLGAINGVAANKVAGSPSLETLELSSNFKLTDEALEALKTYPKLKRLNLSGNSFTGKGLSYLSGLKSLTSLDLSGNPTITNDSIMELNNLPGLEIVKLDGTSVTTEGLMKLTKLKKINRWDLSGLGLTDQSLKEFKDNKFFDNAEMLNVGSPEITDSGIDSLKGLDKLKTLVLSHADVTDAEMENLAKLRGLKTLFVDRTHVTEKGVERFNEERRKNQLPECRVVR
jgi:Leucine-rich repeat (LRR) protein